MSLPQLSPHNTLIKGPYIGRFAPSPSGPLHFGSLVCALASFLHAKQHQGKWLVRIEDIDTPRIDTAMSPIILSALVLHGLQWDGKVEYQSQRRSFYKTYFDKLKINKRLYACQCSRRQIKARSGCYDGFCRDLSLAFEGKAIRFKQVLNGSTFVDLHLGEQGINHPSAQEDPVLQRADGIFAYHLAVVADDIEQGVSHIVRGTDLLDTTPIHLALYQALNAPAPKYLHIPIVVQQTDKEHNSDAQRLAKPFTKLSKQNHAPAIDNRNALNNLRLALTFLGIPFNKQAKFTSVDDCLSWAIAHWTSNLLSKQSEILISVTNDVYSAPNHETNEP